MLFTMAEFRAAMGSFGAGAAFGGGGGFDAMGAGLGVEDAALRMGVGFIGEAARGEGCSGPFAVSIGAATGVVDRGAGICRFVFGGVGDDCAAVNMAVGEPCFSCT